MCVCVFLLSSLSFSPFNIKLFSFRKSIETRNSTYINETNTPYKYAINQTIIAILGVCVCEFLFVCTSFIEFIEFTYFILLRFICVGLLFFFLLNFSRLCLTRKKNQLCLNLNFVVIAAAKNKPNVNNINSKK